MRFTRRRSARPDTARHGLGQGLEQLEARNLLTQGTAGLFFAYASSDLTVTNPITHKPVPYSVRHQLSFNGGPQSELLNNEGKILSGKDRAGNEWTLTLHGPGYLIVTDTTPNDGVLNDDIATIQIVGSNINTTYVTGNVVGSFRTQTNSTIPFNRLVATQGVRSVVLNGFTLSDTLGPNDAGQSNTTTGVFLTGGVRYLSFHDINAPVDTSLGDAPVNVVIGDPSTPLQVQPVIHLDHIFTTVFDSSATTIPTTPVTTPSVNIVVNGQIRGLDIFSTSQATINAAYQYQLPVVGTTGRTAVQAQAIDHLNVRGGATNFTASRSSVPFQSGFSGLAKLNSAKFAGPTDAVGLDVNGQINQVTFAKGLGNPTGVFLATNASGQSIPASQYGVPTDQYGYAAGGYVAGQVVGKNIGKVNVGPSNYVLQTPTNPDFGMLLRQGNTYFKARPGTAMVNSLIVSALNIGKTNVVGDNQNSEIKSGFHYNSFAAGLQGTRAPSRIQHYNQTGSLVNSDTSATYRPYQHVYGTTLDTAGPGTITGNVGGRLYANGGITPLTNVGAGVFARKKNGYLPPPQAPTRVNGVVVR